jgi:branched-chain amino acid transport system ATP-binding protein
MAEPILSLENVHTHIGQHHILQGVSLDVMPGGITVLLGRNGAGKSTTLRTIMGLIPATSGRIRLAGEAIDTLKVHEVARRGVGFVPEDHAVLYSLTVDDNLRLAMFKETEETWRRLETIFELFPDLKRLRSCNAGLLSGGQKQMLAIALAFVNDHHLLLIDEPSKGLAPIIVEQVGESLIQIQDKTKVILVEQNFHMANQVGTDFFILDDGRMVHQGLMEELADDPGLMKKYLGIG